jgi:hypothetical protein
LILIAVRSLSVSVALALALAAPPVAARDLGSEGLTDPRVRQLPARHRLRLALVADWVRASQACDDNPMRCQRFHFAPLLLDVAYQLQFLKYAMFRPSLAFGYNVGNSRNAMPAIFQPSLFAGYQGKLFGAAAGWSFILPFPTTVNQTDGHQGLAQPSLWANHSVQVELSLTSRLDRGALNFGLRVGGMHTHLRHLNLDLKKWYPILTFSLGWFFDFSRARRRNDSSGAAGRGAAAP